MVRYLCSSNINYYPTSRKVQETKDQFFQENINKFQALSESSGRLSNQLSLARIILFVIFLVVLVIFANAREAYNIAILSIVFVFSFGLVVRYHNRVKYRRDHSRFLVIINEGELRRRRGDLKQFNAGDEFIDEHHAYSNDLDLFGHNSLFQLINRTVTIPGKNRLVASLLAPFDRESIIARQIAAKELSRDLGWIQEFQARGMHHQEGKFNEEDFYRWMSVGSGSDFWKHRILSIGLPAILLALLALVLLQQIPYQVLYLPLAVNGIYLARIFKRTKEITDNTTASLGTLKSYQALISQVESRNFSAPFLLKLIESITGEDANASKNVKKLIKYSENLDSRSNFFYWVLNIIFLLDAHWMLQIDRWKNRYSKSALNWFGAVNEFEVINSMAATSYTNDLIWPEISDEMYQIRFQQVGHPLISFKARVSNSFNTSGQGKCHIITGSNMSGKSTFLRTIGLNLILAYAGGPVCAEAASVSIFRVFSGMRTKDDLSENVSSFYAELRRIRQLLDILETGGPPVFYLLDEILKGTNSADRHLGAESLIRQLVEKDCTGLISTHDIQLGQLERELSKVDNYNFSSTIEKNEIRFDYKIREGVCQSFNASKLMENMGIIAKN